MAGHPSQATHVVGQFVQNFAVIYRPPI